MSESLGAIKGDNGCFYGQEWREDAFDLHIDALLLDAAGKMGPEAARIAVDVGCGTGYRASLLARLNIFERVIACDLNDKRGDIELRREKLGTTSPAQGLACAANEVFGRMRTSLDFLQASATELRPERFPKSEISFINFRNVGHFLAPRDFRAALINIGRIAASGALVAVSFDYLREDGKQRGSALSLDDDKNPEAFYNDPFWLNQSHAPYGKYRASEVTDLMKKLGFSILPLPAAVHSPDLRFSECRILAKAPCNDAMGHPHP